MINSKQTFRLSFALVCFLKDNLVEVTVDEGAEIDEVKVAEYHDFLTSVLKSPFCIVVNKEHSYSYTFEAQKTIMTVKGLKAVAIVNGTVGALMSSETLMRINGGVQGVKMQSFLSKDAALKWLESL